MQFKVVERIRFWLGWCPGAANAKLSGHREVKDKLPLQGSGGAVSRTMGVGLFFVSLSTLVMWTPYILSGKQTTGALIVGTILYVVGVYIFVKEEVKRRRLSQKR